MLSKSGRFISLLLISILVFVPFTIITAAATDDSSFSFAVDDDGTVSVTGYFGDLAELDIPATYENRVVTRIEANAFSSNAALTSINIPEGVQAIGEYAFYGCGNLKSVEFPSSLTTIEDYAFQYCSSLNEINLPEGVRNIGPGAFYACSSLKTISLPSTLESISDSTFSQCNSLSTIKVQEDGKYVVTKGVLFDSITQTLVKYPSSLKGTSYKIPAGTAIIGGGAFDSTKLTSLVIPDSVTTIKDRAFFHTPIKKLNIPAGLTIIDPTALLGLDKLVSITVDSGNSVFEAKDGVLFEKNLRTLRIYPAKKKGKSYTIPDGVEIVGSYAFSGSHLDAVQFSSSVTTLQESAMSGAYITGIHIPDTIKSIGQKCFMYCSLLSEVTFEGCLETFDDYLAFASCGSLQSIQLPECMTSLGHYVFSGCLNLSEVILPKSLESIGTYTFEYCNNLKNITIPIKVTSISASAFSGITELTIKGASGSYSETFAKENGYTFQAN